MKYNNIKNILFICKYNAFRSRFAESYFNKLNKNKSIKVISRGFIMNARSDSIQRGIAKKFNGNIDIGKSKSIKLNELIEADLIIVVANDIPKIMFNYSLKPISKKVVVWRIKDEQKKNEKNIIKIVKKIQKKVEKLIGKLEKEK
jgi:protein-tyrosine-phosphatase